MLQSVHGVTLACFSDFGLFVAPARSPRGPCQLWLSLSLGSSEAGGDTQGSLAPGELAMLRMVLTRTSAPTVCSPVLSVQNMKAWDPLAGSEHVSWGKP